MGTRHRRAWNLEREQDATLRRHRLGWRRAPLAMARRARHDDDCTGRLRRCAQGGRTPSWRRMF